MNKSLPKEPERTNKNVSKCELKQITERAKPKEEEQSDGVSSGNTAQHSRETVSTWCVHSPSEFNQQTKFNEIISKSNNQTKQAKTKLKNKTALLTQTKGISQSRSRVIGQENNEQKKQNQTTKQKEASLLNQGNSCGRIKSFKANLTTPRSNDLSCKQYCTLIQSEKRNDYRVNTQRSQDDRRKIDQRAEDNIASEDISSDQGNNSSANSSSEEFNSSNSNDIDWKREDQLNDRTIPNEISENEEEQEQEEEVKATQTKPKIRSFSSNTKSELLSKMQELEGELKRETTRRRRLERQVIQSTSDLTQLMCQLSIFQQNVKETKIFALQAAAKANNKSFSTNNFYKQKELLKEYSSCHHHQHNHSTSQIYTPIPDRTHSFQEETPSKQSSSVSVSSKFKQNQQGNSSKKTSNRNSNNAVISHANYKRSNTANSNNHQKDTANARIIENNPNSFSNQKIKMDTSASAKQSQKNSQIEMIMSRTFQQKLEHESIMMEGTATALSQRQIGSVSKQIKDSDNSLCLSLSKLSVTEQSSGLKSNQKAVQPFGQEAFIDINLSSQNNISQEPKQIQQIDQSRSNNSNSKNTQIHHGFNFDHNSVAWNYNKPSMFQNNNTFLNQQQSQILSNNKSIGDESSFLKQEPQSILVSNSQTQQQLSREQQQQQQQQRQLQNQLFLFSLQQQNEPQFSQTQQPLSQVSLPQSNQELSKQLQQPLFYRTACKTNIQLNSSSQDFLSLADLSCNFKNKPYKSEQPQFLQQQQAQPSVNQEFGLASGASVFSLGSDTLSYSASRKTTPNKSSSSQLFLTPSKSPALFYCPSSKGLKLNNSTSSYNICSSQHGGTHSSQFQTPQKK